MILYFFGPFPSHTCSQTPVIMPQLLSHDVSRHGAYLTLRLGLS